MNNAYRNDGISIELRSTFHAAHRLPALPGKCRSLHGHSWQTWAEIIPEEPGMPIDGIVADFAVVKGALKTITGTHFDHGTILGATDQLAADLTSFNNGQDAGNETKLFLIGEQKHTTDLVWPTVETMAVVIYRLLADVLPDDLLVGKVMVQETDNNRATYTGWLDD